MRSRTKSPTRGIDDPAFARRLARHRRQIEAEMRRRMAPAGVAPPSLLNAMRYSLFAGGKRVRPILAREACRAVGGRDRWVLPASCALEMIHTYSLIHDDLPAMDDDRWRRGKPTSHMEFGEALAILSGDALHTLAFQILSEEPAGARFALRRSRVMSLIARAAGVEGMVGGQVRDLESEGKRVSPAALVRIHRSKTGALLAASVTAGAILGGGNPRQVRALTHFGRSLGLAFQIVDDILDEEGTRRGLGKSPGKDRAKRKATYPAVWGLEMSRKMARDAIAEAHASLEPVGKSGATLARLADFILARES